MNNTTISSDPNNVMIKCNLSCQIGCTVAFFLFTFSCFILTHDKNNRTFCNYIICLFFWWLICLSSGDCGINGENTSTSIPSDTNVAQNVELTEIKCTE